MKIRITVVQQMTRETTLEVNQETYNKLTAITGKEIFQDSEEHLTIQDLPVNKHVDRTYGPATISVTKI